MKNNLTRREFLCLTGKGLVSLAFAGTAFRFGLPIAQAAEKESVNALVTGENEMRIVFLKRADANKSDAFYIMNTTPAGMEVILIDSGRSNRLCRNELLALRSDIVKFTHHGRGRDAAARPTRDDLLTQDPMAACILSGVDGPELAGAAPTPLNVQWYDLNTSDVVYVIKENGLEKLL